jgi:predicted ATP-grasp superfamily ATP-dependent carboligase
MAICDTVKRVKPDVVLPVDIVTIPLLSENRELISDLTSIVSLPAGDSFNTANNKGLLSQWLKKNQISSPPTLLVKKDDPEFDKSLSSFPFPALLKPCTGFGGEGIEIFQDKISFRNYCNKNIFSREFILQSFIKGYDLDCSVLCEKGKILAFTMQKGFANGRGKFRRAAGIDFINDTKTHNLVRKVVEKLNWSGIAHIDLRFDAQDKEVKLIEINPRYWGSLMGSLTAGVNFPYIASVAALKRESIKSQAKPIRYVQGTLALKSLVKNLLRRNLKNRNVKTSIKFILQDPLPTISYFAGKIMINKKS